MNRPYFVTTKTLHAIKSLCVILSEQSEPNFCGVRNERSKSAVGGISLGILLSCHMTVTFRIIKSIIPHEKIAITVRRSLPRPARGLVSLVLDRVSLSKTSASQIALRFTSLRMTRLINVWLKYKVLDVTRYYGQNTVCESFVLCDGRFVNRPYGQNTVARGVRRYFWFRSNWMKFEVNCLSCGESLENSESISENR